jgi:hypothetical protein
MSYARRPPFRFRSLPRTARRDAHLCRRRNLRSGDGQRPHGAQSRRRLPASICPVNMRSATLPEGRQQPHRRRRPAVLLSALNTAGVAITAPQVNGTITDANGKVWTIIAIDPLSPPEPRFSTTASSGGRHEHLRARPPALRRKDEGKADEAVGNIVVRVAAELDRRSPVGDATYWKSPPPKGYVGGGSAAAGSSASTSFPSGRRDDRSERRAKRRAASSPASREGVGQGLLPRQRHALRAAHRGRPFAPGSAGLVGLTVIEFRASSTKPWGVGRMSAVLVRSALEVALAAMSPSARDGARECAVHAGRRHAIPARHAAPRSAGANNEFGAIATPSRLHAGRPQVSAERGPGAATARAELIRSTFYRARPSPRRASP